MRFVIYILLTLATSPAWAKWVIIDETTHVTQYFDPATVRINGNLRRIWILQNLKVRNSDGELSTRMLAEYDCKAVRSKVISLSTHSGSMASGKTILSGNEPVDWSGIPPGSVEEDIFKVACGKEQ